MSVTFIDSYRFITINNFIFIGNNTSPYIHGYYWDSSTGFGTKLSDPATGITTTVNGVSLSENGNDLGLTAITNSPFIHAYSLTSSGFGTKYSDPTTAPGGTGRGISFGNNSYIAKAAASTPYIDAYAWSSSGFGTKYSNPSSLPTAGAREIHFNSNSTAVGVAIVGSPGVWVWAFSSSGFGTKYSDPAALPGDATSRNCIGFNFSPNNNYVAAGSDNSPRINAWNWSNSTGFGTKISNPATLPTSNGRQVKFDSTQANIGIAHYTSPYFSIYPWSTGFGTKYSNPSSLPTGNAEGISFFTDAVAISHDVSPYITAYPFSSSSGIGTKYSNPTTSIGGDANASIFK